MKPKFTALDYAIMFIVLEFLIHYLFSFKEIVNPPLNYLGILPIVFGGYLSFYLVPSIFKKEKTSIQLYEKPKRLVTHGIFKITRNPVYLGMVLILFGFSVLLSSWVNFLFPIVFIFLINKFIIPFEERNLSKIFRKNYLKYKNKVRKWI
jgi:protein-S-isoprenylcysteine O-methyltransferase Ste14